MVNQNKQYAVEDMAKRIADAKAFYLTDYRGLSVNQMVELRQKVRENGGELQVIKNRLFLRALKKSPNYQEAELELTGPTAALWANEDELSPLKTLTAYAKQAGLPQLKVGFFDQKVLSNTEVEQLSKIPGKNELLAQLVGTLAGPLFRLARALNWNQTKLVYALKSVAKNKKE